MPFVAPDPRARGGPYTACYACGAPKAAHGTDDVCPRDRESEEREPAA